jgi:Ca-activated chloride channel family protein
MLEINILKLHARGGTNFGVGFKAAYDILNNDLENSKDFEKRIFFLTDAMPNQGETSPGGLFNMIKEAASKGIYSSIFGMGL